MKITLQVLACLLILTSPVFTQVKFSMQLDGDLVMMVGTNINTNTTLGGRSMEKLYFLQF